VAPVEKTIDPGGAMMLWFALATLQEIVPTADGWEPAAAREEIAPRSWVERADGATVLGLAGRGSASVDGRWTRTIAVRPGATYAFRARYRAERVETPARSVLARVVWLDARGRPLRPAEYPFTDPNAAADGWTALSGTYPAPAEARRARLELHLRWAPDGRVLWRDASLTESDPPPPRKVRLAAVNHRPHGPTPQKNLEAFAGHIEKAAGLNADIVCLPEGITVAGTGRAYADVAEPIPGPSTDFLGPVAARHKIWVVAGLYERADGAIHNTSVLLGRDGAIAGKYRKVCLPDEEIDGGITPGTQTPVFTTDFGRVGMMICWDVHFPEVARGLAADGAELILMPIWGGHETLAQARAIENQLFVVASGYDFKTGIFDRAGKRIAEAAKDPEVIVAEVDLSQRLLWPWLGEWRARIWRETPGPR
jgi:predicted amidohydrolase